VCVCVCLDSQHAREPQHGKREKRGEHKRQNVDVGVE